MSNTPTKIRGLYREFRTRFEATASELVKGNLQNVTGGQDDAESIAIGSIYPVHLEDTVKELMKLWVKAHDTLINECLFQKFDPTEAIYVLLKVSRGVTFDEFQMVLKATDYDTITIDEKDYKHFRAYDFFKIYDKVDRKRFITKNGYAKDDFQDYIGMLERYKVPIVSFFLTKKIPAFFPFSALLKHAYMTAGSGAGKTELIKLIAYNLQGKTQKHKNATVVVFDPQGDFSRECLKFKMNKEHDRVIYLDLYIHRELEKYGLINPGQETFTPVINPFDIDEKTIDAVGKMTIELTRAFEELLKDATISGNMETFLQPCISTLLFREHSSIRDLQRFMQDGQNEDLRALGRENPIPDHRNFFTSKGFDIPLYKKTKDALYQKIQQLLNLPNFSRVMVGNSTINLKKALNGGKVILFSLAKGNLSQETSHAIGKILFAMIQGIAFRRVDTPKEKRKNTFIIADEFQNFTISYVKSMLEEIRQYKIGFLMAQQYAGQGMDKDFFDSILTNTTLKIIGNNDPNTFSELARSTGISEKQLKELPRYNFFVHNRDANTTKAEQKYLKIKTSKALVDTRNTAFYLSDEEYKALLQYLVFTSGQYIKDELNINEGITASPEKAMERQLRDRARKDAIQKRQEETLAPRTSGTNIPKPKLPL